MIACMLWIWLPVCWGYDCLYVVDDIVDMLWVFVLCVTVCMLWIWLCACFRCEVVAGCLCVQLHVEREIVYNVHVVGVYSIKAWFICVHVADCWCDCTMYSTYVCCLWLFTCLGVRLYVCWGCAYEHLVGINVCMLWVWLWLWACFGCDCVHVVGVILCMLWGRLCACGGCDCVHVVGVILCMLLVWFRLCCGGDCVHVWWCDCVHVVNVIVCMFWVRLCSWCGLDYVHVISVWNVHVVGGIMSMLCRWNYEHVVQVELWACCGCDCGHLARTVNVKRNVWIPHQQLPAEGRVTCVQLCHFNKRAPRFESIAFTVVSVHHVLRALHLQ